jgi:hypothetical protein
MQSKYSKFLVIALAVTIIVPQIAFASWWNPMTWGWVNRIFHFQQTEQKQEQQIEKNEAQIVGGDKDAHGCLGSAGYTWCEEKQKCLRTWEEKCEINSNETDNFKKVTDGDFGIDIKVPENWKKLQYPADSKNARTGFINGFQKLEIIKQDLPRGVSYSDWLKLGISVQKNVMQSSDMNIGGKPAYKMIRGGDSTVNSTAITIYIDGGTKIYQLDWAMDENYFNNNQNEISRVIDSMHFTK